MKRFGFVKLARYGLVLTPEGRIMSLRPALLEDGFGGRIVGWRDGDLAAMELPRWERWEPARPAANQAAATRVAMPALRPSARSMSTLPGMPPITVSAPAVSPIPRKVAEAPQVEEDDWEWTIALARARASAEESELAAAAMITPRRRANTVPPPVDHDQPTPRNAATQPMMTIAPPRPPVVTAASTPDPIATDTWPETQPLAAIDYEDQTQTSQLVQTVQVAPPAPAARDGASQRTLASGECPLATPIGIRKPGPATTQLMPPMPIAGSPATIIPVPKLPSLVLQANRTNQLQPVVRAMPTPIPPTSPRRFPKGTGPIDRPGAALAPPIQRTRPEREDQTQPEVALDYRNSPAQLPAVARTVALPSIKRLGR